MKNSRIESLDILRGLVIFCMVVVNYMYGVEGVPGFLHHAHAGEDVYTFADIIFPGFLFMMGISLPLAIRSRLKKGESLWAISEHVLIRGFALIMLGVVRVDIWAFDNAASSFDNSVWYLLFLIGVYLFWGWKSNLALEKQKRNRVIALLIWLCLLPFFRLSGNTPDGAVHWFYPSWWGIMGILGWCYLFCAFIYIGALKLATTFRTNAVAITLVLGTLLMTFIYESARLEWVDWWPAKNFNFAGLMGSHSLIVWLGVILGISALKFGNSKTFLLHGALMAGLSFGLGSQLRHSGEIANKIWGTISWGLLSVAWVCLALIVVQVLTPMLKSSLKNFFMVLGANTLMVYYLPDVLIQVFNISEKFTPINLWAIFWPTLANGQTDYPNLFVLNAVIIALLISILVQWVHKRGWRLKL